MRTAISPRFATRSLRIATSGPALLEEGPQPFLALRARPPLGCPDEQVLLVARLEHEPLRLADRGRAAGEDRVDDARHGVVRVGGDLVDEPDAERRRASKRSPVRKYRRAAAGPIFASTIGEITPG